MPKLVVIAGPAGTGKLARMYEVAAPDPDMRLLHRDQVRVLFGRAISEGDLTQVMQAMVMVLLENGYNVVTVGQNLHEGDTHMWNEVAYLTKAQITWMEGIPG